VRDLEAEFRFLLVGHIGRHSKRLFQVAPPKCEVRRKN
jgi:hypothetical protein